MHRLTARLLLCFAFAGNLGPLALAATAAPHACCVRKAVHHCHDSLASQSSETGQLVIREASNCNHNCCRAVTTARWAHAQPPAAGTFIQNIEAYLGHSNPVSPTTELTSFQSTRAPPHLSIA